MSRGTAARLLPMLAIGLLIAVLMLRLATLATASGGGLWDRLILLALHGRLPTPPLVALTALGSGRVLMLVVAAAGAALAVTGAWRHALLLVVASATGGLLVDWLKDQVARPRPAMVDHLVPVNSLSFPSAHAANSAIVYLTIGALVARRAGGGARWIMTAAVLLTLAIGVSRVALGVHWPSDVGGGWALGAAWALGWWALAERLLPSRSVGKPASLS